MPRCNHCDAHVSERFARVSADAYGRTLACPNCSANAGIPSPRGDARHNSKRAYDGATSG